MPAIEVVYAKSDRQMRINLQVASGTTVKQAIEASGLLQQWPEINLMQLKVGIYSQLCDLGQIVEESDRIEIYRPLVFDPKEARRQRAARNPGLSF